MTVAWLALIEGGLRGVCEAIDKEDTILQRFRSFAVIGGQKLCGFDGGLFDANDALGHMHLRRRSSGGNRRTCPWR